ncbi:MAG: DUF4037 domain-containing protein [Candidatus Nealsonbacteria bacterium DGGOD1a]|jgi:hypothetical protein|nr:MAG: DUF4037 domain-containing protein [Candidatus Nealsonbacteria bacterium DGGOD1a]
MESDIQGADKLFNKVLEEAKNDPNILAFWLDGSRGKGIIKHAESDYDCMMIVADEVLNEYKSRYEKIGNPVFELGVMTLNEFKKFAAWDSDMVWYRYNYVGIKPPLVDKTGQIKKLFDEKASIPENVKRKFISDALDYYVNEVYRSLKCFRDGQIVGARLEASESMLPLLNTVFAIHGRLRPYYKYYEWELRNYPLSKLSISGDEFTKQILIILGNADIKVQQKLLMEIENITRKEGYGDVWDSWGDKIDWMRHFQM